MNLLVTGAWNCGPEGLDHLTKLGHTVEFLQYEKEPLPCDYAWVEGIICNGLFLHHDICRFTNLRLIQLTSAGYDRVPMDYAREKGIRVLNARDVYSIPMAEFALSGVLELYKEKRYFYDQQKAHRWEKRRNLLELNGKTVCIVGCGSVGTACAKLFSAMGCHVTGVARTEEPKRYFDRVLGIHKMQSAISDADIVIAAVPLTSQTTHLFDQSAFSAMKPGAVFVNISRGGVADTQAMTEALQDKLLGAVLDVFEEEPLSADSPLWNMPNVILTPHCSFEGEHNRERLLSLILSNLEHGA